MYSKKEENKIQYISQVFFIKNIFGLGDFYE